MPKYQVFQDGFSIWTGEAETGISAIHQAAHDRHILNTDDLVAELYN